jgi:outer membrane cobalamin receptor
MAGQARSKQAESDKMLLALILSFSMADASIAGVVMDSSGGAIPGASVVVRTDSGAEQQTVTGPDGRFSFDKAPTGPATLVVRAAGFAVKEQPVPESGPMEIVLAPAALLENVTVTPTRSERRLGDVAASVNVLDSDAVRESPAVVADDVLRQIPTFSLFTRASSLSSHPTSQGVSLRGIGPSGVSRTLVMADSIPQNDPFGGWVYWTRVPLASVDRIEVVDGPSSSLYGNYAMGGVINILTARPSKQTLELKPQYGNHNSPKLDFLGGDVWRKLGAMVEGSLFDTDGFPIVAPAERGPIDNNASVNFRNVNVKLDYTPANGVNTYARAGYFHENRDNGKISTFAPVVEEANDTTWKFVSGGTRIALPDSSGLQASLFTDFETFHSNFLAVPATTPQRSVARGTLNQTVPAKDFGGMVQWSRAFGSANFVTAGTDWHWVDGESQEDGLDAQTGTSVVLHRVSGGTQQSVAAFVQDIFTPVSNLTLTLGVRLDHWGNYNAHSLENTVSKGVLGAPTVNNNASLPEQTQTVGTPRAAAMYRLSDRINIWGDVNSGFRAPTLNELYRQFRKGAVTTLANYALVPERLVGGEGGVNITVAHNVTVRATVFDNHVQNPVTNVTITTPVTPVTLPTATATCIPSPSQVCVQRQNVGRTEILGFQADVEYRFRSWRVTAGYLYDDATVKENITNPALVGNLLPEVPKNRGSVQVAYVNPKLATVAFDIQGVGAQFDDDLNTRVLPGYAVADFSVSRTITKNFDAYIGMQNIFNAVYDVATLPTTIGSPRLVNGGLRIRWSGR